MNFDAMRSRLGIELEKIRKRMSEKLEVPATKRRGEHPRSSGGQRGPPRRNGELTVETLAATEKAAKLL